MGTQILYQINLPNKRVTLSSLCWTINKSSHCLRERHHVNILGKIVQNQAANASAHKMCRNVTKPWKTLPTITLWLWINLPITWLPTCLSAAQTASYNSSRSPKHEMRARVGLHSCGSCLNRGCSLGFVWKVIRSY